MNAPLVVKGSKSIQLAMQVEAVSDADAVEILAPKSSNHALDELMRARHERDVVEFLDVETSQIRSRTMISVTGRDRNLGTWEEADRAEPD